MNDDEELGALWTSGAMPSVVVDVDAVRRRATTFRRTIFWRDVREVAAALLIAPVFIVVAFDDEQGVVARIGAALLTAGLAVVLGFLARSRRGRPPVELDARTSVHLASLRAELLHQRALSAHVHRWYVGPLVPGYLTFIVGLALYPSPHEVPWTVRAAILALGLVPGIAVAVFLVWVNRRAALKLEAELAQLPP